MTSKRPSTSSSYADRFIPLREADHTNKDLHPYDSLTQKTDELIAEALASDPSLGVLTDQDVNIERLSQLALTQHKRTSFLIEKMMPQQTKLLKYTRKSRVSSRPFLFENENIHDIWKKKRRYQVKKKPVKILEAPGLLDDYYLNLVVWGQSNIIGVGLEDCVYFYIFNKNKVVKHFDCSELDLSSERGFSADSWPYVCSMSFNSSGNSLAVADSAGRLALTDTHTNKVISSAVVHNARIGSLHWQYNLLVSGSRDSCVNLFDTRKSLRSPIHSFEGHHQEICGLKLSPDNKFIASGGNDNECMLWSLKKMKVTLSFIILFFSKSTLI
jgi:cell division cycle 20-like protein 1 (cofactor of APC complex)